MNAPVKLDRPTQELLPWLFPLSEGVVVCKDSGLLASFTFDGVDGNATTDVDLTTILARLDSSLKQMSDQKVSVWWTVHRRRTTEYPESSSWTNPLAKQIDQVNQSLFLDGANFINRHYVSFLLHPPEGSSRYFDRVSSLVKDGMNPLRAAMVAVTSLVKSEEAFAWAEDQLLEVLSGFETLLANFESGIQMLGMHRLVGKDLYGFLTACAAPDWQGGPAAIAKRDRMEWFLDSLLANMEIDVGADVLKVMGCSSKPRYAAAMSVKAWPDTTSAGAIDALLAIPCELTVSHIFRFAGKEETKKQIDATKRFNELLKHSLKSWIVGAFNSGEIASAANPARVAAAEECNEALGYITDGSLMFGWQNSTVVVYGDDEDHAKLCVDLAARVFNAAECPGVIRETIHLVSALASTMPGQWRECKRWALLSTDNFEDVAPVRTILRGETENRYLSEQTGRHCPALTVLRTDYSTPFYFNFHHGALGHTLVVGPSRTGKSVFMNFLVSQWQKYTPCRTIIFDKDYSCKIATLAQGGGHIDLSDSAAGIKINPMALVDDPKHWPFLCRWIDGLVSSKGYSTDADDERAIREAIEDVAEDASEKHKRLLTVYTLLPERLKKQLEPWVGNGALANYFDNIEDDFTLGKFSCIEMGAILRNQRVARAFMDYAFYRIQCMMEENRGGEVIPTFIYLEECWFLLEDPAFAERIRDWLKTMAKMTCHIVMATQSLEDIAEADSKVFSSMRDNIMTYIFLPNAKARTDSLRRLYRREFEITDEQIATIADARPQEQYFIVKPGVARLVSCRFSPDQLAVFRSDARAQGVFGKHFESGDPDWVFNYIQELNHE